MDLIGPCRERIRARKAGHEDLPDKRDIALLVVVVVVVVRVMVIEDGSIRTAEYITATRSFLKLVLVTNSPKILRRCSPSDLRTSRTRNLLSASAVKQRQSGTMKRFLSILRIGSKGAALKFRLETMWRYLLESFCLNPFFF